MNTYNRDLRRRGETKYFAATFKQCRYLHAVFHIISYCTRGERYKKGCNNFNQNSLSSASHHVTRPLNNITMAIFKMTPHPSMITDNISFLTLPPRIFQTLERKKKAECEFMLFSKSRSIPSPKK